MNKRHTKTPSLPLPLHTPYHWVSNCLTLTTSYTYHFSKSSLSINCHKHTAINYHSLSHNSASYSISIHQHLYNSIPYCLFFSILPPKLHTNITALHANNYKPLHTDIQYPSSTAHYNNNTYKFNYTKPPSPIPTDNKLPHPLPLPSQTVTLPLILQLNTPIPLNSILASNHINKASSFINLSH